MTVSRDRQQFALIPVVKFMLSTCHQQHLSACPLEFYADSDCAGQRSAFKNAEKMWPKAEASN